MTYLSRPERARRSAQRQRLVDLWSAAWFAVMDYSVTSEAGVGLNL